ncbi:M48 family metallopeptidase [Microcella sp.]|uniref:M48 family metallopeptidase n=1 Tax=Microcella sp. TaxID=1913979 RepID=UPI00391A2B98
MYRQIARNKRWSILLIALFCVAVIGLGVFSAWVVGDVWPFWLLLIFCPLYVWWALSSATTSAASTAGWAATDAEQQPRLHRVVETTAIRAGIPMPKVGVIDDPAPNAFAASLSPKNAVIGVTTGALDLLDDSELEAVVAHEVAHIVNQDGRVTLTTFALVGSIASVAGVLMVLGWGLVRSILSEFKMGLGIIMGMLGLVMIVIGTAFAAVAFVLGPLISSAVSRRREFLADASGVELTRYPEGLVRALEKIHAHPSTVKAASFEVRGLFFVNTIGEGVLAQWLGSHPPVAERVERLKEIGRGF